MRRVTREPGHLQIDQAKRNLRRADIDSEYQRPARGDVGEATLRRTISSPSVLDHAGRVLQQHGSVHAAPRSNWITGWSSRSMIRSRNAMRRISRKEMFGKAGSGRPFNATEIS